MGEGENILVCFGFMCMYTHSQLELKNMYFYFLPVPIIMISFYFCVWGKVDLVFLKLCSFKSRLHRVKCERARERDKNSLIVKKKNTVL